MGGKKSAKKNHKNGQIFNPLKRLQRRIFDPASLDEQSSIDTNIKDYARDTAGYYILVIISVIIITIGLIINSPAVVIGGMIIAPVIWPLLELSVGVIHGRKRMLQESIFTLLKTIALILIFSFLIGLVSPLYEISEEILSRTGPTLFNLIIALAAGFGAAFASVYARRSATIFGVAIAVALVPPLCALGVLLSAGKIDLIGGALLLFLTNLVAILISSMTVFALAKFSGPKTKSGEENKNRALISTFVAFLIICIPLIYLTYNAISLNKVQNVAYELFQDNYPDKQVGDIKVTKGKYSYHIDGQVFGEKELTVKELNNYSKQIAKEVERSVSIDFNHVPITSISTYSEVDE
ncbi:MAG: TIGR00341 family protein [Patescibacteria group bacterium]|nr:TIGR00341 family protein [Patescibacteria group bacterium]